MKSQMIIIRISNDDKWNDMEGDILGFMDGVWRENWGLVKHHFHPASKYLESQSSTISCYQKYNKPSEYVITLK
jgi:hypothetical protein